LPRRKAKKIVDCVNAGDSTCFSHTAIEGEYDAILGHHRAPSQAAAQSARFKVFCVFKQFQQAARLKLKAGLARQIARSITKNYKTK